MSAYAGAICSRRATFEYIPNIWDLTDERADVGLHLFSERGAVSGQMLGQLQPFVAAFPPECMGRLASSGPT